MRQDPSRGMAPADPADGGAPPISTARDAPSGGSTSSDAEEQLLAWLSGTAQLQAGPAGSAPAGPANPSSTTASSPDSGAAVSAPVAASAAATAVAAVLSNQSAIDSSGQGGPSDGARTDSPPLSSDPSQSANALLSSNAVPVHLAGASHAGAVQQPAGQLQSPVGTSAWVEELGAQLSWMANRGIESASLHVSPAELGPIEVRIAMHGSDASIWFGAAQATTRSALEQALPQLRQLLASHGLALADAGVFREPPRGSAQQPPPRSLAPVAAASEETSRTVDTRTAVRLGLLDLYA